MSYADDRRATQALAHRLASWGVDDAAAKAGAFMDDLKANGWRMDPSREARPQPPKPSEACRDCGRHTHRCACDTGPELRVVKGEPPTDTYLAARRTRHPEGDAHE